MDARKCHAHSKRDPAKHCGDWAEQGAEVCRRHGARAPQVKAKAERRRAEAKARRALATYGVPVTIDPLDALLAELYRTAGHVAWLADLIADLEHAENNEGKLHSGLRQWRPAGEFGGSWVPAVWVEMYQAERAHLARVAKACLDAGVEERRVKLAEDQGRIVADVLRNVIGRLSQLPGVTGLDVGALEVREVVRDELMKLAAPAGAGSAA